MVRRSIDVGQVAGLRYRKLLENMKLKFPQMNSGIYPGVKGC